VGGGKSRCYIQSSYAARLINQPGGKLQKASLSINGELRRYAGRLQNNGAVSYSDCIV